MGSSGTWSFDQENNEEGLSLKLPANMDEREKMVYEIKKTYGLGSPDILSSMLLIPREKFVDPKYQDVAYNDCPVSIGFGQTMSQPYTVAFMTDLLELTGKEKVLEIGTGSGYQAALLSKLAHKVYTVEIIPELAKKAKKTLKNLGYKNIFIKIGSGEWGWQEHAPYEAIMITAGIEEEVPRQLFDQLAVDGILIAPIGQGEDKVMTRFIKKENGQISKEEFGIFHFVPFVFIRNK